MLKKKLTALINVKTLVTFAVTAVFVALALRGSIASGEALAIVTVVIGFYFGTQKQKNDDPRDTAP